MEDNKSRKKTRLIINADDFGIDPGIDNGILLAHREKVVTSTSLFINFEKSEEAARILRGIPSLGVGLHFNITWGPLLSRQGEYSRKRSKSWAIRHASRPFMRAELKSQIVHFIELMGRVPDHLDSHQHIHIFPHIATEMFSLAVEYKIPAIRRLVMPSFIISPLALLLRLSDSLTKWHPGIFRPAGTLGLDSKSLDEEKLAYCLGRIGNGTTWELMCHPGLDPSPVWFSEVQAERRKKDLSVLLSPRIRTILDGMKLVRFGDLQKDTG